MQRDKRVHAFPKGISPKMKIIVQLEFKLTQFEVAVHHFSHYAMRTTPPHTGKDTSWSNDKLTKLGGARGVMVIVVGIEHDDTSSNPG